MATPAPPSRTPEDHAASYQGLRVAVGALGFMIPAAFIVIGGLRGDIRPSISAFYSTTFGDILVGGLSAIAIFLFSYRGYTPQEDEIISDLKLARITAIAALGVAFLPTDGFLFRPDSILDLRGWTDVVSILHFLSAATFLGCLGVFSLWKFTRSGTLREDWSAEKVFRNRIYVSCGWTIFASIGAIALIKWLPFPGPDHGPFPDWLFWLETLAVWAFALSWLVKGESLKLARKMISGR